MVPANRWHFFRAASLASVLLPDFSRRAINSNRDAQLEVARALTAGAAAAYIKTSPQLAICHAAKTYKIRAHLIPIQFRHNPITAMQKNKILQTILCAAALLAAGLNFSQAQTTATWIGPVSGGEWNTGANWDTGAPPLDSTTNAVIGVGTNVNYNVAMAANPFGTLQVKGILNINTTGFNSSAVTMTNNASRWFINNGGVANVTGGINLFSNSVISIAPGGTLTASGTLSLGSGAVAGTAFGIVTNTGGTLTVGGVSFNGNNASVNTSSKMVITGGTNNLGAVSLQRNAGGAGAPGALGSDGLIISNGVVTATNISVGNNAHGILYFVNGSITNSGNLTVRNSTQNRPARFLQTGGSYVTTAAGLAIMNPTGAGDVVYSVLGGTNQVGGIQTGLAASAGTVFLTNAASIFIGTGGITTNGALNGGGLPLVTNNILLNPGGRFAASADWTNAATITLAGGTFDAQDIAGVAHNIYSAGVLRGTAGVLIKTGSGVLTLGTVNTYSGNTLINAGTLVMDAGASNASPRVIVGSGATFDVSPVTGGYMVGPGQSLSGSGVVTGAVAVAVGGFINPGSNLLTGTLSFSNSITEAGFATNHFDLAATPGPNNDFVSIAGDLNVSATNYIEISGGAAPNIYPLIKYAGNFNGDLTNFALAAGAIGALSNSVAAKTIYFLSLNTTRNPTNVTWVGNANPVNNNWDATITTNWVNGTALDYFIPRDNARFNAQGAPNPLVNIVSGIQAGSVTVDTGTSNYVFTGNGSISEVLGFPATLTKTNSGTLTILTTNSYTGPTIINGGVLEVAQLANGGAASAIGAADNTSGNLQIGGATLRYTGVSVSTDHGATITGTNSVLDVTNSATTLTVSGSLTGSGTLAKSGAGILILSGANGHGATTVSNGTLQVNSVVNAIGTGPLNLAGGTVRLNVSGQQTYPNALNVITDSTMISAGGNNNIVQAPWSGSGVLNLDIASGTFTVNANMTTNFTGTVRISDTSTGFFRFNGGGNGNGAQQTTASRVASFDLGNGSVTLLNRNGGAAAFGNYDLGSLTGGASTIVRGASNGGGPSNACTYVVGAKNLSTTFAGTILNGAGGAGATTALTKVGSGILSLSGASTYSGNTTISNGTLALINGGSDGSIANSPSIRIISGAFLDVSALATPTLVLGSGQTLSGNGTVNGNLDSTAGTVSPGDSIGTLTITNVATLNGTTYMELNRTNGAQTNDILAANSIVLGGTLTVTNLGPNLVAGDRFVLFKGPTSGAFTTTNLPGNLGSITYTWTNNLALDGSIRVLTAVTVNTTPTNITTSVSGNTLTLSWPTDHTGWRLQAQTNTLGAGLGTTWSDVIGTETSNTYNATINSANGTVFYRMVYP